MSIIDEQISTKIELELDLDKQSRVRALDTTKSYIVQAPAGSGKTELLSQRVLNLLSIVDKPEEILALTFTRKAASEMRARIINSLKDADKYFNNISDNKEKLPEHKIVTYNLAQKVINRDKELSWNLLQNPSRLNITTIDSLCVKLTKQIPVLSKSSGNINIVENPEKYYKQAVDEVFKLINTDDYNKSNNWTEDFVFLLEHLHGNYSRLKNFLLDMLYKREQWLPYIANLNNLDDADHDVLLQSWHVITNDILMQLENDISDGIIYELKDLLEFASNNIKAEYSNNTKSKLNISQEKILNYDNSDIDLWQAISYLLLSTDLKPNFRKAIDKRLGFPAGSKNNHKKRLLEIITELKFSSNKDQLIDDFNLLRQIPSFDYSRDNLKLLQILSNILILLEAELRVIYTAHKITDFSSVNQSAIYALGTDDSPTDLTLWFDYSINHILIDEFQDTSFLQYNLLTKMVYTWDSSDSKTIFCVGDPMQSIYRFRQAEVGLFLQVKDNGIGNIKLDFLELKQNFRSSNAIVDWVNDKFKSILPDKSNSIFGAVSYSSSVASNVNQSDISPELFLFDNNDINHENNFILDKIKDIINNIDTSISCNKPEPLSIAILVRNRTRVSDLVLLLKQNGININSVDIESLSSRMVIQDLLSLTKSVLDLSDKVAWYSVLRAPWCGLSLDELYYINSLDNNSNIYNNIINDQILLSNPKLTNLLKVLDGLFSNLFTVSFSKLVKQAWLALGGNLIYSTKQEYSDALQFFDLLFKLEESNYITDIEELEQQVNNLYSNNQEEISNSNYILNIMTVHKSKGLQFDYVFIPYLDQSSKANSHQILAWQQYHNESYDGILLAPFYSDYAENNQQVKFYHALRYIEKKKESYELARLFYVAVTRAVHRVILTASFSAKDNTNTKQPIENLSDIKVSSNSLLGKLINSGLELAESEYNIISDKSNKPDISINLNNPNSVNNSNNITNINRSIKYIDYKLYNINNHSSLYPELFNLAQKNDNPVYYELNDETMRLIGICLHKILYNFAINVISFDNITDEHYEIWRNNLLLSGVGVDKINHAMEILSTAVKNIINDETARWILADYEVSYAELEIYYYQNSSKSKIKKSIIDRVFVDNNSNTLWIIDYKLGDLSDQDNLDEYKAQLRHYKYLIKNYFKDMIVANNYSIQLALYNPLAIKFEQV